MNNNIVISGGFPLSRHSSEYILIRNLQNRQLYRLAPGMVEGIPGGYEEVREDEHKQPVYKPDGRLKEKYWCLIRYREGML